MLYTWKQYNVTCQLFLKKKRTSQLGIGSNGFYCNYLSMRNFPVVMDGCESWTVKKAEGWRIDAF